MKKMMKRNAFTVVELVIVIAVIAVLAAVMIPAEFRHAGVPLVTPELTGAVNMLLFPRTMLLGASGVVFAFILISSVTVREDRTIPVTFILVALLYLGQQVYEGITVKDNVSQMTHIAGGAVGSVMGFLLSKKKRKDSF